MTNRKAVKPALPVNYKTHSPYRVHCVMGVLGVILSVIVTYMSPEMIHWAIALPALPPAIQVAFDKLWRF